MSTTQEHLGPEMTRLIDDYIAGMPVLDVDSARVAVGLWRRLADGAAVARADLADGLGVTVSDVDAALDGPLAATWMTDHQQRIRAFWALSLADQPTPHRLRLEHHDLYAWCAVDTLFLPLLVGRTLEVESSLTPGGEPIRLVIHTDRLGEVGAPDDLVVSFVPMAPDGLGDSALSIMSTYCHHMLFFPSTSAGRQWATEHRRDDLVFVPLHTAFEGCQRLFRTLLGSALDE